MGWDDEACQVTLPDRTAPLAMVDAELDYQHTATAGAIPNDSSFSNQWGLLNTGQAVNGYSGPAGADVKAPPAWSVATGTNRRGRTVE
jgi:hypothetical protein